MINKMVLGFALVSGFAFAGDRPLDNNGRHVDNVKAANLFADAVESIGYTCDTISAYRMSIFTSGEYTLTCNNYRYVYTIRDKGGRWTVEVE